MLFEMLRSYDNIIWDWNGTLLADVEAVVEANSRILMKRQLSAPTLAEHRSKFAFPIQSYYESLGVDLAKDSFEGLTKDFVAEYSELVKHCLLFEGTDKLLTNLVAAGKVLAILSAAEQTHLETILNSFNLRNLFTYVYGISNSYGNGKIQQGKSLLVDSGFDPTRTILVGDTDHDLHVGKQLGIDVLLIADGHQDYTRLIELHDKVLPSRFSVFLRSP